MLAQLISILQKSIFPKSKNEDIRRREFILNILLVGFISLITIGTLIDIFNFFFEDKTQFHNDSLAVATLIIILLFFWVLYMLSRIGQPLIASCLLTLTIYLLAAYMGYRWGIDIPAELIFYALAIVIAGILIEARFAFLVTLLSAVTMIALGYLQRAGAVSPNQYWRQEAWSTTDVIVIILIYTIIATVSWLSNREIERSLVRARRSESALMKERDLLEVRVQERTNELRIAELERMSQAYRFVEFGRVASGIFHDLTSPLTALSLNIQSISDSHGTNEPQKLSLLSQDIVRAKSATTHMQKLMDSMRRHIAHEGVFETFSIKGIVSEVVHTLTSYAQDHEVMLSIIHSEEITTVGDAVAFTQVLTNLLSNAIESFPPSSDATQNQHAERKVQFAIQREKDHARVTVKDTGPGISKEVQKKIFEPFFSTKQTSSGLGIGLSLAKRIIEKEFKGTLSVESESGKGSTFTIYFPIREP